MKQLSDSFQMGPVTVKNRIAVPAMVCFDWTDDSGRVTDRHLAHYRALAQGGAGVIFSEAVCITKRGRLHNTQLGLWEDEQMEGWKRLADACHEYGVPFLAQIHHAGINGIDDVADCPSDYTPAHAHHTPGKEMSLDRIVYIRNAFVKTALRCKAAGLDGVELHGCHGYLLSQFMSRKINHRTDEYGEDDTLFVKEILESIRIACGPDFCVGIRLAAFEPTMEDGFRHAKALAPYVDFLDISYGIDSDVSGCPADFPYRPSFYAAMKIKEMLPDMPIFCVDMITSGEMAKGALELTQIDGIDVGRGHLVNYNFASDTLAGRDTGTCLHCKGGCSWGPTGNPDNPCPGKMRFLKRK